MFKEKMVAVLALAICSQLFGAQVKRQPVRHTPSWPLEPTAFFGVELDQQIASSISACPTMNEHGFTHRDDNFKGVCFEEGSTTELINVAGFFNVFAVDGPSGVGEILASFHDSDAASTAAALIARFGQPTTRKTRPVTSRAGVTADSLDLMWIGKNVVIEYNSIGSHLDQGLLIVNTRAYRAKAAASQARDAGKLADSF